MVPFGSEDARVSALRELLPATGAGIYLDTATAGPFPAETDRALHEADDWELRVGRVGPDRVDDTRQRAEEARAVIAALLGTAPDRVLLSSGPVGAVAAFILAAPSGPIRRIAAVDGLPAHLVAGLERLSGAPGMAGPEIDHVAATQSIVPGIDLVIAPHVDAVSGGLLPLDGIIAGARAAGALVLVDASLAAGAVPVSVVELQVAAVLVEGHRWLLGPEGVAALCLGGARAGWGDPAAAIGANAESDAAAAIAALLDQPPRRALLGLARSLGWLLMYGGLPWVLERTGRLARALAGDLAAIDGVEVVTPAGSMAAMVSFRIAGWTVDDAADELGRRVFAILGRRAGVGDGPGLLQASVGAWNTDAELVTFVQAVDQLAHRTPDTLPRRAAR